MAIERRWPAISPRLLSVNGTATGEIVLSDTSLLKVKHQVILKATGEPDLTLEIKRFLSPSSFIVGPKGHITLHTDVSAYTTAKNATLEAPEQNRPAIPDKEYERAVYEEEPTVAKRVFIVDEYGSAINENNPLSVEATIAENAPKDRYGFRKNYTTANVEESQIIPNNTKKLYIAVADKAAKLRISFSENGTIDAIGNDYITVEYGNSYFRENLKLVNKTLYYQASKAGIQIEIETWV